MFDKFNSILLDDARERTKSGKHLQSENYKLANFRKWKATRLHVVVEASKAMGNFGNNISRVINATSCSNGSAWNDNWIGQLIFVGLIK